MIFSLKKLSKPSSADLKLILVGINTPLLALKLLGRPIDSRDDLIIFYVVSLFDNETNKQWELYLSTLSLSVNSNSIASTNPNTAVATELTQNFNSVPPTFSILIKFIESQISILESIEENITSLVYSVFKNNNVSTQPQAKVLHVQANNNNNNNKENQKVECLRFQNNHFFSNCNTFKNMSPAQKYEYVKSLPRCCNCLGKHKFHECQSKTRCATCKKKHHTTLHDDNYVSRFIKQNPQTSNKENLDSSQFSSSESSNDSTDSNVDSQDLLVNTSSN